MESNPTIAYHEPSPVFNKVVEASGLFYLRKQSLDGTDGRRKPVGTRVSGRVLQHRRYMLVEISLMGVRQL